MENYYIKLHATEIKDSAKHYATESVCAHFRSEHKPATPEFVKDMKEAERARLPSSVPSDTSIAPPRICANSKDSVVPAALKP